MKVSPLGVMLAIVVLGVTIELVEGQDKRAGYVLGGIILLGVITFNAGAFRQQVANIGEAINGIPRTKPRPNVKPIKGRSDSGGGASFS